MFLKLWFGPIVGSCSKVPKVPLAWSELHFVDFVLSDFLCLRVFFFLFSYSILVHRSARFLRQIVSHWQLASCMKSIHHAGFHLMQPWTFPLFSPHFSRSFVPAKSFKETYIVREFEKLGYLLVGKGRVTWLHRNCGTSSAFHLCWCLFAPNPQEWSGKSARTHIWCFNGLYETHHRYRNG